MYWYYRRYGGIFKSELIKFKERENYTSAQWEDYQSVQFKRLLLHAFDNVEYYRVKYLNYGLSRENLSKFELDDIEKLPYLEKDDLRRYGTTTLLSKSKRNGTFFGSSGSTGTPTQIFYSKRFHQAWSALFEARIRNWAGLDRFNSRGMIGGRKVLPKASNTAPFYRVNHFERQIYFSAYHISQSNLENYRKGIETHNLDYMTGYAASNYFLARLFLENNIYLPNIKAVITSSEKLTQEMREVFKKVYNCKTYDSYSGVEACGLISENEYGELLFSPDSGILELIKDNGEYALPGESGEVVSTGFLNYDQPLIRYRIGDIITLSDNQTTSCGRTMPVISEISGRIEDKIITKDGRQMVRFHSTFIGIPDLKAAQVIQNTISEFEINLFITRNYSKKNDTIVLSRLYNQLGEVIIKLNHLEKEPVGENGKFKAVISKIK